MRMLQTLFASAIFLLIFGAAFGGGSYFLMRNVPMIVEGWQSRSWPSAMGEIKESAAVAKPVVTDRRRGAVGTHVVQLQYEFTLNGETFSGTRQALDDVGVLKSQEQATREADALPEGSSVRVFYNPGNPSRSLLSAGVPIGGVIGSAIGLVLIAGGSALVAVALWLRAHHAKRRKSRRG